MLIAKHDDRIVEGALALRVGDAVKVDVIAIEPDVRRQGIGRRLMQEIEGTAIRLGARAIYLGGACERTRDELGDRSLGSIMARMDHSSDGASNPPCGKEIVGNVGHATALLFQKPRRPGDRFDPQQILTRVASTFSKLRHGTWVTLLMNNDPSTSAVVVTDDANQQMAEFVDRYIASLHRPGVAPTTGLSQRVIESGRPLVIPKIRFDEFVPMNSPAYREYLGDHQLPIPVETVSLALVPMRARGGVIGTLGLARRLGSLQYAQLIVSLPKLED